VENRLTIKTSKTTWSYETYGMDWSSGQNPVSGKSAQPIIKPKSKGKIMAKKYISIIIAVLGLLNCFLPDTGPSVGGESHPHSCVHLQPIQTPSN